jgi:putative serine/threonine protein kinase
LYYGFFRGTKIAIKTKNPKSQATNKIEHEIKWLKRLNKYSIGPKLLIVGNNYFAYKFVEGHIIIDYLKRSDKNSIKKLFKKIFHQLFIMDKLSIDKQEMHHPIKHIIIRKNTPTLIDFERCKFTNDPKNVTQFCQFITSKNVEGILNKKGITINKCNLIKLAKIYKSMQNQENLLRIISEIF